MKDTEFRVPPTNAWQPLLRAGETWFWAVNGLVFGAALTAVHHNLLWRAAIKLKLMSTTITLRAVRATSSSDHNVPFVVWVAVNFGAAVTGVLAGLIVGWLWLQAHTWLWSTS